MHLFCRLGIHSWSKFTKPIDGYGGLTQFSYCRRCNRLKYIKCYGEQVKAHNLPKENTNVT